MKLIHMLWCTVWNLVIHVVYIRWHRVISKVMNCLSSVVFTVWQFMLMVKSSMKLVLQVLKAMVTNWHPNWLNSSNCVHASKFVVMTISVIKIGCVCTKIDTCVMSIDYIAFLIMYCVCALEPCTASCVWWWYWYQLIDRALRLSILGKRVGKPKRVILGIKLCRWLHHGSWFANHWAMD